jgi:hypothetical protein
VTLLVPYRRNESKRDIVAEMSLSKHSREIEIRHVKESIFPYLENPRDMARTRCVCKSWNDVGKNVSSVSYVCREKDYETRREENACERALRMYITNLKSKTAASQNEGFGHKGLDHTGCKEQPIKRIDFRQVLEDDLRSKPCISQLRIEIEPELQSKSVPWPKRQQIYLWLSDPCHLLNWVSKAGITLQHLCIVDYGQQAMTKKSYILKILSQNCSLLETIDLRNMCINTNGCEPMPKLTSFMLQCVEMNGDAFDDISDKMGSLQTLAMRGVFGIQTGCLSLPQLKVLCLELSTKAGAVKLDLPSLSKLQLKTVCPEELCITAPAMKFIAFNLKVPKCSEIQFKVIPHLQAPLYETSNFLDLSILLKGSSLMNKVPNLDIPDDGKWLGLLKDIASNSLSSLTIALNRRPLTIAAPDELEMLSLAMIYMVWDTTEAYPDERCIIASALKLGELRLEIEEPSSLVSPCVIGPRMKALGSLVH